MPQLEFEMMYHLTVRGPLPPTEGAPRGARVYWEMADATLEGERINARSAMRGIDWFEPGPDGFGRPDVRLQFITADNAIVLLRYSGLVEMNAAFTQAAETGRSTRFEDHYMRMAMVFETGHARYSWLNQHLFVAEGRLAGEKQLEYRIYRVT
jgi:hypothetical protein